MIEHMLFLQDSRQQTCQGREKCGVIHWPIGRLQVELTARRFHRMPLKLSASHPPKSSMRETESRVMCTGVTHSKVHVGPSYLDTRVISRGGVDPHLCDRSPAQDGTGARADTCLRKPTHISAAHGEEAGVCLYFIFHLQVWLVAPCSSSVICYSHPREPPRGVE